MLDVASEMRIEKHTKDFGHSLGYWGVAPGPYLVLPLLGPSSLRETVALPVDMQGDIVGNIAHVPTRNTLTVGRAIDTRSELLKATAILEQAALDKYAFTRDAYLQGAVQLGMARRAEVQTCRLVKDIKTLTQWLRRDVLALAGPCLATRVELFDFVTAELVAREHLDSKRIRPVRIALQNQRDDLLAFAGVLDGKLDAIAQDHDLPMYLVRQACLLQRKPETSPPIGRAGADCAPRWGTSVMPSLRP